MAENGHTTAQTTIAEIEARRAARKDATAKARAEQYAQDLAKLDELEVEHGDGRVSPLTVPSFVPGLPTIVVVKTPSHGHFERFRQQVRKGQGKTESTGSAKDLLATVCLVYPDAETYARMKEAWPSIHDAVGAEAIRLGETEGKD